MRSSMLDLTGKSAKEAANLKAQAIVDMVRSQASENAPIELPMIPKTKRGDYDIEILDVQKIEGGVEVFARAWQDKDQIGFGKDGSVDIERFRFINPPVYVEDPKGDIVIESIDEFTGEVSVTKLRLDPQEKLLQRLAEVIAVKKEKSTTSQIKPGKIGNTTTTVDFTAGDSHYVARDNEASWAAARDATDADFAADISTAADDNIVVSGIIGGTYYVRRADFQFNTAAIPSGDVISSAVVQIRCSTASGFDTGGYDLVALNNTDNANLQSPLATEDFNDFGTTSIGSRDLTDFNNAGAFVALTLTDYAAINKGGVTRIGLRLSGDIDNSTPSGYNTLRTANQTDMTYIVVEHAAAAGFTPTPLLHMMHFAGAGM